MNQTGKKAARYHKCAASAQ